MSDSKIAVKTKTATTTIIIKSMSVLVLLKPNTCDWFRQTDENLSITFKSNFTYESISSLRLRQILMIAVCRTIVPRALRLTTIPSTSGPPIGDLENSHLPLPLISCVNVILMEISIGVIPDGGPDMDAV